MSETTVYSPVGMEHMSDYTSEKQVKRPNAFVRNVRKAYNPLGFKKGYNFVFFFITAGALLGFCLYNIRVVDVDGYWLGVSAPGEPYFFTQKRYNIGMKIHLISIIPAGILAVLQFFPIIRYKAIMFHRFNGWLVTLLLLVSNASALVIADGSFGGRLSTQAFVGIMALATTVSATLGVVNIKRKQIDQHRKWMMRTWIYAGSIVTLRLIQVLSVMVSAGSNKFSVSMNCAQLEHMGGNVTNYPSCTAPGTNGYTVVTSDFNSEDVEEIAASLQMAFGPAGIMALILHAVLTEIYFHLTPNESERLRTVSYEKQLERGHKHPGSSGLTSDRLGDAPWWTPAKIGKPSRAGSPLAIVTSETPKSPTVA